MAAKVILLHYCNAQCRPRQWDGARAGKETVSWRAMPLSD